MKKHKYLWGGTLLALAFTIGGFNAGIITHAKTVLEKTPYRTTDDWEPDTDIYKTKSLKSTVTDWAAPRSKGALYIVKGKDFKKRNKLYHYVVYKSGPDHDKVDTSVKGWIYSKGLRRVYPSKYRAIDYKFLKSVINELPASSGRTKLLDQIKNEKKPYRYSDYPNFDMGSILDGLENDDLYKGRTDILSKNVLLSTASDIPASFVSSHALVIKILNNLTQNTINTLLTNQGTLTSQGCRLMGNEFNTFVNSVVSVANQLAKKGDFKVTINGVKKLVGNIKLLSEYLDDHSAKFPSEEAKDKNKDKTKNKDNSDDEVTKTDLILKAVDYVIANELSLQAVNNALVKNAKLEGGTSLQVAVSDQLYNHFYGRFSASDNSYLKYKYDDMQEDLKEALFGGTLTDGLGETDPISDEEKADATGITNEHQLMENMLKKAFAATTEQGSVLDTVIKDETRVDSLTISLPDSSLSLPLDIKTSFPYGDAYVFNK